MKRVLLGLSNLCFLTLFALSLLSCQTAAEDQSKPQDTTKTVVDSSKATGVQFRRVGSSQYQPAQAVKLRTKPDVSSITIVMGDRGPAELLLTDSKGRCTGVDAHTGDSCREIPNAHYFFDSIEDPDGEGGEAWKKIQIMRPMSGDYRLTVTGAHEGKHNISLSCYDINSKDSNWGFRNFSMANGEVHSYALSYDKTASANTTVTGGFDGGGELSPEVISLLSYVNVAENNTKLPSGTQSFDLFIIYGKTVLPESFTATLNGSDVSNLFAPKARGYEFVSIPIATGENALVLSIAGTDADAQDTDSLMFFVE